MAYAPERDGQNGYAGDEPLEAGEFIFHWSDRDNRGAFAGLEGYKEKDPDEEY